MSYGCLQGQLNENNALYCIFFRKLNPPWNKALCKAHGGTVFHIFSEMVLGKYGRLFNLYV